MSGPFRKSVLQHRIALETIWPLAFPAHDFATLRLNRQSSNTTPALHWDEEAWAASARGYHEDRRRGRA
jgi:hypothetical protein